MSTVKTTKITFAGSQGFPLAGRLEAPAGSPPRGYALFAHCFTCSKNLLAVVTIARALAAAGIAVLRFDFTGLGESEGEFADTDFSSNVEDLVRAAGFLEGTYAAPRLLVGHSLGGTAVLQAAPRIPSCAALVTIAAPSDPADLANLLATRLADATQAQAGAVTIGGRTFRVKQELLDDLRAGRVLETLEQLELPLLVLHSAGDRTVAFAHALRLFGAARGAKSLVTLPAADHLLARKEDVAFAARLISLWAAYQLGEP